MLSSSGSCGGQRGLTLIEALVVLCIASILAGAALPSYQAAVCTGRRSDALAALSAVQNAEEHYRSAHTQYGAATDIGAASLSQGGNYRISVPTYGTAGYVAVAMATGAQRADAICRCLQLTVSGAETSYASGPDSGVGNAPEINRQCWRA